MRPPFPYEQWNELSNRGLFSALKAHGIGSAGFTAAIKKLRELGAESLDRGLTFSAVTQLASTIYCLRAFATTDIQKKYLPGAENGSAIGGHAITEAEAGSDIGNMSSLATRVADHYVLTGQKRFITNAPVASTLIVYTQTREDDRDQGISAFIVETTWPGVDTSRAMPTAGLHTSPIGEVTLDHVLVPATHRIGAVGAGMLILDQVMKREILLAFAGSIGEMEQRVSASVHFVNERMQFGKSIGSNQLVADHIVQTQIAIELGGALLNAIASRLDGYEDVTIPIAAAKIFISEANVNAAIGDIKVRGGSSYLASSRQIATLLDALPGAIYSGSNDLLRSKIASMLGIMK